MLILTVNIWKISYFPKSQKLETQDKLFLSGLRNTPKQIICILSAQSPTSCEQEDEMSSIQQISLKHKLGNQMKSTNIDLKIDLHNASLWVKAYN